VAIEFFEKRRFQRVPLSLPVSGKCLEKAFKGHNFQGETRDVSFDGLCIKATSSNRFKAGQKVKLKIRLYKGDFPIKAKGIICWVDSQSNLDWPISMGVKLTRIRRYGFWCERIENKIFQE
jgi:hypothetical protein